MAPTLVASRTTLPPEGALRLRPGKAGSAAPAGKEGVPTLVASSAALRPEGAAASAGRYRRSRGPGWYENPSPTAMGGYF